LHVSGKAGTRILLRHAETLASDGGLYIDNLRSARATNLYTLSGRGMEVWEPRFTYHGFRYVEVIGYPGEPKLSALEGRVVHDALTPTSQFESSNAVLNRVHRNMVWGFRGNYRSIPTDCPQRDERQGWLGDRSLDSLSESYLFDVAAFYEKWMQDIADSQRPTGSIPDVAPSYWKVYKDDVTWPATFLLIHQMLYEQYGDTRVLVRDYPAMRKWIAYMQQTYQKDGLMPRDEYGDWCVPPEAPNVINSKDPSRTTPGAFLGTAYFHHLLRLMARFAGILGKPGDAREYELQAEAMRTAFERAYFNAQPGSYANGTQTSSVLPLAFGITPQPAQKAALDYLLGKIGNEAKGHVGVGLIGAQWLVRLLSDLGHVDVAYRMATKETYPSWGYMARQGATTIWELWNGDTADAGMNSGNHLMMVGDLGAWMYGYLGGIRSDPETPGFRQILIRPYLPDGLKFTRASFRSQYGTIATHWQRQGNRLQLDVRVPPNTTATVSIPAGTPEAVLESEGPAKAARGVRFLRLEDGRAMFSVGSGNYRFRSVTP
ncbi:MAG: family 78 glycoside hydrolase catalytic domain, partial [Acidobacteria bacterium]|nr:family 78 glycoside hydrolase catalytic domain [Acidobacteriota bacterium]